MLKTILTPVLTPILLALLFCPIVALACVTLPTITAAEVSQLEKLANGGDVKAMVELGYMYEIGNYEGGKRDWGKAVRWWKKAAAKGDAEAEHRLAEKYYNGYGVKQDYAEANKLYLMAADQGYYSSQLHMWVVYEFGTSGEKKDPFKAYMWHLIADKNPNQYPPKSGSGRTPDSLKELTPEQVAKAKRLAEEWKPKPHKISKATTKNERPIAVGVAPATDCKG